MILAQTKKGQNRITIETSSKTDSWTVSVIGDWYSNYGIVYNFKLERFCNGEDTQIIGMESGYGMTKTNTNWIYKTIKRLHNSERE